MKVFSVITIFFLGLYLQGCAPRLDYGGPGTIAYRNVTRQVIPEHLWELVTTDQEKTIPNVGPIFRMVEDFHLDWNNHWLDSMVTYVPSGWWIRPVQGPSLNIHPTFVVLGVDSQRVASLKPHEYQKLERFLLNILNPTPATSPAIRAGQ